MPSCWLGHPHPSKSERAYCNWLRLREKSGDIRSFRPYPSIKLHVAGKIWKTWKADFEVINKEGKTEIHESKGWNRSNESFRLKAHAFLIEYPKIPLFVNRVHIPPDSKQFAIPGLKDRKSDGFTGGWLKKKYVWDKKAKKYVFKP